jgi:DNA repair protein RadC
MSKKGLYKGDGNPPSWTNGNNNNTPSWVSWKPSYGESAGESFKPISVQAPKINIPSSQSNFDYMNMPESQFTPENYIKNKLSLPVIKPKANNMAIEAPQVAEYVPTNEYDKAGTFWGDVRRNEFELQQKLNRDATKSLTEILKSNDYSPAEKLGAAWSRLTGEIGKVDENKYTHRALETARQAATAGAYESDNKSTGSKIGDFLTDTAGSIAGFGVNVPGMNVGMGGALDQAIGKKAEEKIANKLGASAPEYLSKGLQYATTAGKTAAEFGTLNSVEAGLQGRSPEEIALSGLQGAASGAVWGMLGKAYAENVRPKVIDLGTQAKKDAFNKMGYEEVQPRSGLWYNKEKNKFFIDKKYEDFYNSIMNQYQKKQAEANASENPPTASENYNSSVPTAQIQGIGKVEVVNDLGDSVVIRTMNGQEYPMNKIIYQNSVIEAPAEMQQIIAPQENIQLQKSAEIPKITAPKENIDMKSLVDSANQIMTEAYNTGKLTQKHRQALEDIAQKYDRLKGTSTEASPATTTEPQRSEIGASNTLGGTEVKAPQKASKSEIKPQEIMFTDRKGLINGGTVTKTHDKNLMEVEYDSENGKEYALVKKNRKGEFEFVNSKPTTKAQLPMENRTNENVGNRQVKAYQYLHPEVRHFIQGEAHTLLGELKRTKQGSGKASRDNMGQVVSGREARVTTQDIASLLDGIKYDGKQGSKYAQIEKALNSIIEDHGAENNALAKKIELVIDDRLSNGYFDDVYGDEIPPSKEYVDLKNKIEGEKKVEKAKQEAAATKATEAIKDLAEVEKGSNIRSARGKAYYTKGLKGLAFNRQLINKGIVNLKGQVVRTPAEVAAIAQVFRDPRFETFRIIYLKGETIVGHEGFTSRVPNMTLTTNAKNEFDLSQGIKETMKKMDADGYYMLHNHPSGEPKPSKADYITTKLYKDNIPGYLGHIIINSNKFAYIYEPGNSVIKELNLGEDKLLQPEKNHDLLGKVISSSTVAAQVAKEFQLNKNTAVVLYLGAGNKITAIQEVDLKHFEKYDTAKAYLKPRVVEFGASKHIIVTGNGTMDNDSVMLTLNKLVGNGITEDVILNQSESWREKGLKVYKNQIAEEQFFDEPLKGIKVKEEYKEYETKVTNFFKNNGIKGTQKKSALSIIEKNLDNIKAVYVEKFGTLNIQLETPLNENGKTITAYFLDYNNGEVRPSTDKNYNNDTDFGWKKLNYDFKALSSENELSNTIKRHGRLIKFESKAAKLLYEFNNAGNNNQINAEILKKAFGDQWKDNLNYDVLSTFYKDATNALFFNSKGIVKAPSPKEVYKDLLNKIKQDKQAAEIKKNVKTKEDKKSMFSVVKEPTSDYTTSPQFKKWFENSKVVDSEGKPLVVYHGTSTNFDIFNKDLGGYNTGSDSAREGFFFTNSQVVADTYRTGEYNYKPVWDFINSLIAENPDQFIALAKRLDVYNDDADSEFEDTLYDMKYRLEEMDKNEGIDGFRDFIRKGKFIGENYSPKLWERVKQSYDKGYGERMAVYLRIENPLDIPPNEAQSYFEDGYFTDKIQEAKKQGYDGVIFRDIEDAIVAIDDKNPPSGDVYVVFSPNQIKSATGNNGDFDTENPSIVKEDNTEYKTIEKETIKYFGTTSNFKEAGYLTTSGKLLDFSGKKDGGEPGYRSMDHRDIADMNDYDGPSMTQFMDMGNIRMKPESDGFELTQKPTSEQVIVLKRYINSLNGEVIVDLGLIGKHNSTPEYMEYPRGTKADRVINDINKFYDEGKVNKSTLADFHNSVFEDKIPYNANGDVKKADVEKKITSIEEQLDMISPGLQGIAKQQLEKYKKLRTEMIKKGITKLSKSQVERLINSREVTLPRLTDKINKLQGELRHAKKETAYNVRFARAEERLKARNEAIAKKASEKESKEEKARLEKRKKFLKKVQKKLKYMRPEYQEKVNSILDGIQLTKPTEATLNRLKRMKEFFEDEENKDMIIPRSVLKSLERLNKVPFSDLTEAEQIDIVTAIQAYVNFNNLKNQLIFNGRRRELKQVNADALDNIRKRPIRKGVNVDVMDLLGERNTESSMNVVKKIFTIDSYDPELITQMLDNKVGNVLNGSNGIITKVFYKDFNGGNRVSLTYEYKAMDELKKLIADNKIKVDKWSAKFQKREKDVDVFTYMMPKTKDSKNLFPVKMSREQRMEIYLNTFNPKNLEGLLYGGISIDNKLRILTPETLKKIIADMSKEEKLVADKMLELLNKENPGDIKEGLNRVSTMLNGYPVAMEEGYWPKNVNEFFRHKDASKTMNNFVSQTIEGQGHLKERTGAVVPIKITGAFQTFVEMVHLNSVYIGLANPVRNAKTLLNNIEFRSEIYDRYGKEYYNAIKKLIEDIESNALDVSDIEKFSRRLLNNITTSIFGLNPFIPLKQPIAYINAITEIEPKYLRKALLKKPNWDEIKKYDPVLRYRAEGNNDREIGELGEVGKLRTEFTGKTSLASKTTFLIGKFDLFEIGRIWEATKLEVKDLKPELSGDAYWNMVSERAEEIINRHQPSTFAQNRSEIARTKNFWERAGTMFTSQANKVYNQAAREFLRYNTSQKTAKDKSKLVGNLITILLVTSLAINAVDNLRNFMLGRENKNASEQLVSIANNMIGNIYFVGPAWQSLSSKITKGTWQGQDIQNPLTSYAGTVIDALAETINAISQLRSKEIYKSGEHRGEQKWETTAGKAFQDILNSIMQGKGIPYNNIKNIGKMITLPIPGSAANKQMQKNKK